MEVSRHERDVSTVTVSGSTVTLTLDSSVQAGQAVTVSYDPPATNPIMSTSGEAAAAFTDEAATNSTPATVPTLAGGGGGVVVGSKVVMTFNEPLDAGAVPLATAFRVSISGGAAIDVLAAEVYDDTVTLMLATPAEHGQSIVLDYVADTDDAAGGLPLQDLGGTQVAQMSAHPLTNSTPPTVPVLWAARVGDAGLVLTYSRTLDSSSVPANGDFTVTITGSGTERRATVESVAIEGREVVLTLDQSLSPGESATLDYTPGSRPLRDQDQQGAASLADHRVLDENEAIISLARLQVPEDERLSRRMYPAFHPDTLHYAMRCSHDDTVTLMLSKQHARTKLTIEGHSVSSVDSQHVLTGRTTDSAVVITLTDRGDSATYVVHCIPQDLATFVTEYESGAADVLYTFWSAATPTIISGRSTYIGLVDNNGVPRFHAIKNHNKVDVNTRISIFRYHPEGKHPYSYFYGFRNISRQTQLHRTSSAAVVLRDDFTEVQHVQTTADIHHTDAHDFGIRPNGNYVLIAYESAIRDLSSLDPPYGAEEPVEDSVIQEVTPGGAAVMTWNSFDHMAIEDCQAHRFPYDYAHVNSLYVVDDSDIVGSFRGCSQVFRINGDGEVVWKVGRSNRTTDEWTENLLDITDDPYGEFCGLHGASITRNGNLLLFDNGTHCQLDAETLTPDRRNGRTTRVVEYALDETANTATWVRDYSYHGGYDTVGNASGYVTELDNGNWLISWGSKRADTNFYDSDPNTRPPPGASVTEVDPATGEELFAMRMLLNGRIAGVRATPVPTDALTFESVDSTAPRHISATVDGTRLSIVFDEDLDEASPPAAADLTVTVNDSPADLDGTPSLSGRTVTATLAASVTGADQVTVEYTGAALRDTAAVPNAVAAFGPVAVQNHTSAGLSRATINGRTLALIFDKALDESSTPTAESFAVTVSGVDRTVRGVEVDSTLMSVSLTIDRAVQAGEPVLVSYMPPISSPIQDTFSVPADSFSGHTVMNTTAVRAPRLSDAVVDTDTLTLTYDEDLDTGSAPPASSFTVTVTGDGTRTVIGVDVATTEATLTLAGPVQAGQTVRISYAPPASRPIRDIGGTPAAALTNHTATNTTAVRAPRLRGAVVIDGPTMTLTYDEDLDTGSTPPANSFTVNVDGEAARVTSVSVPGDTVTLTLAGPVQAGQTVRISYAPPASRPIRDIGGTPAAALTNHPATNTTAARAPELDSAVIDGPTITLTYDEDLDTGSTPPANSFTVTVTGEAARVTSVSVPGDTVTLTLAEPVQAGQTVIVSYAPPASRPIRDIGGTPADSFSGHTVMNTTAVRAPRLSDAVVDTDTLTLTYDEDLDTGSAPPASSFTVTVTGDGTRTVTGVDVATTEATLTLAGPVQAGQTVRISYAPPASRPIRDIGGTPAAALTNHTATNTTAVRAPRLRGAVVIDGPTMTLTYDEDLDTGSTPPANSFTVTVTGDGTRTVTGVDVATTEATLTLAGPVQAGQTVRISYAPPASRPIRDIGGTPAAALTNHTATNTTAARAPRLSGAVVIDGPTITLTYDEDLDTGSTPPADSFTVNVDGEAARVTSVSVPGDTVTLTLAEPVQAGQTVRISYAPPASRPIRDVGGTPADSFSGHTVTNTTAVRAPRLSDAVVDTDTLTLAYDEDLDTGSAPPASSFTVTVTGDGTRTVTGVVVATTEATLTLAGPVQAGQTVRISYAPPASRPIRDIGGTPAAALTNHTATNTTAVRAPRLRGAVVIDGPTITLTYDEDLDTGSTPPADSFTVNVDGEAARVTSVSVPGDTVTLTLAGPVQAGQTVRISYAPPASRPIRDIGGTPAAALTNHTATNTTAARAPELDSAVIDGPTITLTYDEDLDTGSTPPANSFTVTVDGEAAPVESVQVANASVTLTFADDLGEGRTVLVSYVRPASNPIRDIGGTPAAVLTGHRAGQHSPTSQRRPPFIGGGGGGGGGAPVEEQEEQDEQTDDAADLAQAAASRFQDVSVDDYYAAAVGWMVANAITAGCTNDTFCASHPVTRQQLIVFLWRAAAQPEPATPGSQIFSDVTAGSYADKAIGWAAQTSVTAGCAAATTDHTARFCGNQEVTRAQISALLYRYFDGRPHTDQPAFTDIDPDAYYTPAVSWMAANGITAGCGDGTRFCPDSTTTRAQTATFIHRAATRPDTWGPNSRLQPQPTDESP